MTSKTEKWFITGASRGLGLALTRRVLEAGNTVVAAVRNPAALAELQAAVCRTAYHRETGCDRLCQPACYRDKARR